MPLVVRELGLCPYSQALQLQEELVGRKFAGDGDDYLLLLEHPPVYTLGRGADADDLRGVDASLGVPSFRVGRGGGVTFHGPGQLVAYPIRTLRPAGDVHAYVQQLEETLIRTCTEFGIAAQRRAGAVGVWVGRRKIASIGVGVRRCTTLHGIALNVATDLEYFRRIVPCRMPGLEMTSMAVELGVPPSVAIVRASLTSHFRDVFGYPAPCAAEVHA